MAPGAEFIGDDYFIKTLVHTEINENRQCRLVRIIENPIENPKGDNMNEDKLILDQPETVTTEGVVEHVVKKLENKPVIKTETIESSKHDILLNEDPMNGIEILG